VGLVQAGGSGARLGFGPKAFITLGGATLVERAVATLLETLPSVIVAVRPEDRERAAGLVAGECVTVIDGGATRWLSTCNLIAAGAAQWLVFSDVVHPFVTPLMLEQVLDAARTSGAAALAVRNSDFLYDADCRVRARAGELIAWQKPVAVRRDILLRGVAIHRGGARAGGTYDPALIEVIRAAGVQPTEVPGSVANFKLTELDDLAVAGAILAGTEAMPHLTLEARPSAGNDPKAPRTQPARQEGP
jgi:2-C-methyl-D-erythritol 4-phosphate cytidylyltransferase